MNNPKPPEPALLDSLMEKLREELGHYGEMMVRLDQQQQHVMSRSPDEIMNSVGLINQQMEVIQKARQERESLQDEVAQSMGQTEDKAFATLIPYLPEKFQGAVQTLVRENNTLLQKVQKRARQNHLLLSRSLELMQHFLTTLSPAAKPKTYNGTGKVEGATPAPKSIYEAVG